MIILSRIKTLCRFQRQKVEKHRTATPFGAFKSYVILRILKNLHHTVGMSLLNEHTKNIRKYKNFNSIHKVCRKELTIEQRK